MRVKSTFAILPDLADAKPFMEKLPFVNPTVLMYPSGRPWVVGHWGEGEVVEASVGTVRAVVIGHCPITTAQLQQLISRIRNVADVDVLARRLSGTFHLIAYIDGTVRAQGSLAGLRRLFHTRKHGITIAADRADVLATVTRTNVNERILAARVTCGGMLPPPLGEQSVWSNVSTLPADSFLAMESGQEVQWWRAPQADVPLEQGVDAVKAALVTAVASRQPDQGRLSADLSGGMDSTALCFLAADKNPELLTFRWGEAEAGNDDARFAAYAATALPQAEHLVVEHGDLASLFSAPQDWVDQEQPYVFTRTLARTRQTAKILAEQGSQLHLTGHGGDELFYKFPGYLHRLARRQPWMALKHLRGHSALSRWPLRDSVRELAGRGDINSWWRAQSQNLTMPAPASRFPPLEWNFVPLRAAPWVTDHALDLARSAIYETAETVRPFAEDRGQHQFLLALRTTGPAYAQLSRVYADYGVQLHMPYLDDRVIEAALTVLLHERATPWRYKPLLAAAMRGIVPEQILSRSTKGEFSADLSAGRRKNMSELVETFRDSTLAQHDLIDVAVLRKHMAMPQMDSTRDVSLEHLLGCENWLKNTYRSR